MRGISWLAENRLASQEGLSSMEYTSKPTLRTHSLLATLKRYCGYQIHVSGSFLRTEQSCGCLRRPHLYRTWNFITIHKRGFTECYPESQFQSKTPHKLPYLFYLYSNFILSLTHTFFKRYLPSRFTERIITRSPFSISAVHILRYQHM